MTIQFVTGVYATLTYLTSYLCKPEDTVSELMKKASKETCGKDMDSVLSLPMRHVIIDVLYVPTDLKTNRTRMLKSQSILEKMHPEDTNVFASNIIDKYDNRSDDLHFLCLADFASNYDTKKSGDVPVESDDIKDNTVLVSNIDDIQPNRNVIALKNMHGEMPKCNRHCVICFHKGSKLKNPEEHYMRLLQLYMPCRNEIELKQDNKRYGDRYKEVEDDIMCNVTNNGSYLDIDYEELENFSFVHSDDLMRKKKIIQNCQ